MEILEDEVFKATWADCTGDAHDFRKGYKESLEFCIRKKLEAWTIDNFKTDLEQTKENSKSMYGPYKDGIIAGLQFNINKMEEQTNEYSCTS